MKNHSKTSSEAIKITEIKRRDSPMREEKDIMKDGEFCKRKKNGKYRRPIHAGVKAQEQLRDSRDDKESPWIASVPSSHLYSRKVAIAYAQSGGRLGTGPEDGEIMTPDQEGQVDVGSFAQYKRPLRSGLARLTSDQKVVGSTAATSYSSSKFKRLCSLT
ncbi:hypothetical protein V6N12_057875 [Hibiscus sabdariffa]|uniref:Uncharacterized protein n=1 Tax=Hibiscus sabdariffa TaxID=183260 RepID=A0ABR2B3T9_9ROSI